MNRKLSLVLSLVLLATLFAIPTGAGATTVPDDAKFFLRSSGGETCADHVLSLSTRAGSGESVCGYRNGAPFGEIYEHTGLSDGTKMFTGLEGLPVAVDAIREITGTITVGAYLGGVGGGVGQLVLDIDLSGRSGNTSVSLGSTIVEQDLDPTKDDHEVPFTVEVPEGADGKEITSLTIAVDVRGVHMGHGFMTLDGMSHFTLPILVDGASA